MSPPDANALDRIERQLQVIRGRWSALGLNLRAGVSPERVADFEAKHRVQMPLALRRYYELMDGMENGETDDELNSFWPLSDVASVPEKLSDFRGIPDYGGIERALPGAASYFVFADQSIWLQVWAIRLSEQCGHDHVYAIGGAKLFKRIASSFADFLEKYATDPKSVTYPHYG